MTARDEREARNAEKLAAWQDETHTRLKTGGEDERKALLAEVDRLAKVVAAVEALIVPGYKTVCMDSLLAALAEGGVDRG